MGSYITKFLWTWEGKKANLGAILRRKFMITVANLSKAYGGQVLYTGGNFFIPFDNG